MAVRVLPRRRVLLSCLLPARGYRGLRRALSLSLSPNLEPDFLTRASQPAQAAERRRSRPGKPERRWGGGSGSQRLGGPANRVRRAGLTRPPEASFSGVGGALRGRKLVRRRRKTSRGPPLAGRGGGWGHAGVGRMRARCAGCAGAASPKAEKPGARGAWLLEAAAVAGVRGGREAAAALAKQNLRASKENGLLFSRDYSALKVSQTITDMQFSCPLKASHPTVARAQASHGSDVYHKRKGAFRRDCGGFFLRELGSAF